MNLHIVYELEIYLYLIPFYIWIETKFKLLGD